MEWIPAVTDKLKFGGPSRKEQCCAKRKCESTVIVHTPRSSCWHSHHCHSVKVHCCPQQGLKRLQMNITKSLLANWTGLLLTLFHFVWYLFCVSVVYTIGFTNLHSSEHAKSVAPCRNCTRRSQLLSLFHTQWLQSGYFKAVPGESLPAVLVQQSVRRMAKRTLKEFQEVSEVSNISQNARIWSFLGTAIFPLLAAALS